MKQHLTVDRFRTWLAVVLLAVLALGSFWVQDVLRHNAEDGSERQSAREEPDYYVEKFNFIKLSNNGNANYHITGERLIHHPRHDNIEILQPRINSFDQERSPLHIRAERAMVEQKSAEVFPRREHDQVHLYDQVSVERPAGENVRYMKLQSDYLLLLPDEDSIKTDTAVSLFTSNSETHAVGMEANNATQQMTLLSKVRMRLKRPGSAGAAPQ